MDRTLQSIYRKYTRKSVEELNSCQHEHYKEQADIHRGHVEFKEGDQVLVRIRPKRFPAETFHKLHSKKAGPFDDSEEIGNQCLSLGVTRRLEDQSHLQRGRPDSIPRSS